MTVCISRWSKLDEKYRKGRLRGLFSVCSRQKLVRISFPPLEKILPGGVMMKSTTTSWVVTGLGAVVSGLGATMRQSRLGTGILGFGLAHIVLGVVDMIRPLPNK